MESLTAEAKVEYWAVMKVGNWESQMVVMKVVSMEYLKVGPKVGSKVDLLVVPMEKLTADMKVEY